MNNTFQCDFCDKPTPNKEKWYALTNRPSDPSEIVAVMWGCSDCGRRLGLSGPDAIQAIEKQFEEKGFANFGGQECLFLTI